MVTDASLKILQDPLNKLHIQHIELPAKLLDYFLQSNKDKPINERIYTSCSECGANVYADDHNICLTRTPAHA